MSERHGVTLKLITKMQPRRHEDTKGRHSCQEENRSSSCLRAFVAAFGGPDRGVIRGQRRLRYRQPSGGTVRLHRVVEAVRGDRLGLDAAAVADVAAAVDGGVAVEQLGVVAGLGHADAVALPRHGREVEHRHHEASRVARRSARARSRCSRCRCSRSSGSRRDRSRARGATARADSARSDPAPSAGAPRACGSSSRCQSRLRSWFHSRHWPNSPPMNSSFLPGCANM